MDPVFIFLLLSTWIVVASRKINVVLWYRQFVAVRVGGEPEEYFVYRYGEGVFLRAMCNRVERNMKI